MVSYMLSGRSSGVVDQAPSVAESCMERMPPMTVYWFCGRILDEFSAPAGATLVSEGDYGYEFMILEEGTVDVIRHGRRADRQRDRRAHPLRRSSRVRGRR
jgi:hypothetical protein